MIKDNTNKCYETLINTEKNNHLTINVKWL